MTESLRCEEILLFNSFHKIENRKKSQHTADSLCVESRRMHMNIKREIFSSNCLPLGMKEYVFDEIVRCGLIKTIIPKK